MRLSQTIFRFSLLLSLCGTVIAGSEFDHPHTHLGATNPEGKITTWIEAGNIPLPNGGKLPFRLLFSALPPSGMPVFGKFWWCPLFESTLVPLSEGVYRLSTLGGRYVYLVKKKDGTIASTDEAWKGKQGADSQVELNSPGGWNYIYRAGRIAEAACSDGTRLRWNYQHNLFKSLSDSQQGTLVSVEYGTEGLPVKISTSKDSFTCGVQKVPVVANAAGVISGFEYTLAGISSGSRFWKSPIVLSPEGDYSMEFSNSAQPVNTFVWNAASGILKSEGGWTYEVKKRDDDRLLVSRKNHEGGVESYFYDDKTGVSEQTLPDGSRIVRSYFIGLGPTQYKIRKYAKLRNGKEIDASQWSYDEKGRTIRKISGDNQRIWGYSPDGHLLFQEETFAGALARRLTYDLHGRLASSVHPGIELRYAYDSGKRVAQRLESGKVMAAHVADTAGGPGHLFFTKSGSGELESRGEVPQKSALQELENSKIVALRAIAQLKNETPH